MARYSETPKAGEAGHHGRDRQPAKESVEKIKAEAPDEIEAATPREVKERSEAAAIKRPHESPDHIRPKPRKEDPAP